MDIIELIKSRRSIRKYKDTPVKYEDTMKILDAGRWAPSGLNNQPWRFVIIEQRHMIEKISELTKYRDLILGAKALIVVFLDGEVEYNRTKDCQAIGACIENMLLAAQSIGLGACWCGEILNRGQEVGSILDVPGTYELMAVITLGYPAEEGKSSRDNLTQMIYDEI